MVMSIHEPACVDERLMMVLTDLAESKSTLCGLNV